MDINKFTGIKFIVCLFFVVLMAIGILFTKLDLPFSISFIIPIIYLSVQKDTKKKHILTLSVLATLAWDFNFILEKNQIDIQFFANSFLRLGIYLLLSYLLLLLTKQRAELSKKNLELEALNKEKNDMLGIAAHDIRNTASAIYSFSGILLERISSIGNSDKEIKIARIINESSDHLLKLVSKLLDISKIESGQIQLNKIPFEYYSFIESRINLLQIIAQQKNILIVFERSSLMIYPSFDPIYMAEVIDNLISNAIKFSKPQSEIKVIVKVEDNNIKTEVIDSGIGIISSELNGLFKPFYKTSSKPTGGEKSSGLGLAIAAKVVRLHGGDIGVKSKVNEGSVFYFTLPIS